MKKIIFFLAGLFFLIISTSIAIAGDGSGCESQGGHCKTVCSSTENDIGDSDCPQGGVVGGKTCCVPKNSPTPGSDLWCPGFENQKLNTAIGCIPVLDSPEAFLGWILRWAIGVGGGIAFLLIVYAGFLIMTSQGNPERLQAGKELLTSAISGLILLIFSIFILKVIGVDILQIPGFG